MFVVEESKSKVTEGVSWWGAVGIRYGCYPGQSGSMQSQVFLVSDL